MNTTVRIPSATELLDDHLGAIKELVTPDQRRRFFASHPNLRSRATVESLAVRATSLLRVDPREADSLITTSTWLAEELQDDFARAKAYRAHANFAHVKGNEAEAFVYYDSARDLFNREGADLEAAITASSSLQTLAFLGKHDRALDEHAFAKAVFERGGDRLRLARLNSNYASLLYHRDRWAEAAEHYEAAYRDFLEIGEKQDVAVCLGNMAVCHLQQQDFVQALEFYKQTRAYCERNGLSALTADLDYNIAYLHYLRGQYTTALELYRETRSRHSELGDQHHVDLCALNEAEIYLELNLTEECADLASAAYSGFCDRGLSLVAAKALTILAVARSRQGKLFLSLELLSQARELFHRENSEKWAAVIDLYRAALYARAGRPFESRRLASRADQIFQKFGLTTKSVACRVILARLALRERSYDTAKNLCREAIAALERAEASELLFQAHLLHGDVARAQGNRSAALESYLEAHHELGRTTGAVQTEEQRIQALDDKLIVYETLVELLAESDDPEQKAQSFAFMEKAKSRSLTDLLAFRAYALPETQPGRSKLADQVRQLREELNWYYRQIDLQEMRAEDRSTLDLEALRRYSRQQETRLIRTLNLLQQTDQQFTSVQEAYAADLPQIIAALPADTTLLEYYVTNGTVLAVVLHRGEIEVVPVTLASTVDELRLSLSASISRAKPNRRTAGDDCSAHAHLAALYEELVEPVAELLRTRRLLIVPHGSLFYLPFHAFRVDSAFLGDRFSITYAPSSTSYQLARLKAQAAARTRSGSLVVASEEGPKALEGLPQSLLPILPGARLVSDSSMLSDLAGVEPAPQIVHIVTEAHLRPDNPMFSTILLGADQIHLFDLFQLRLDVDLVAIAGCAPGLEAKAKGNELVGLVRGLLYAGAQSVLTTLWNVDVVTWEVFSQHFYASLSAGESIESALRHAVRALRQENDDPRFWAPFVLFGGGN